MRKITALVVATLAATTGATTLASPAEAAVKWNGRVVLVINKLPSNWPVKASVDFVDQYTATDMRFAKRCDPAAWRCITLKTGKVGGGIRGAVGWSNGWDEITIDTGKAAKTGQFGPKTRKYLLVHELGHGFFLEHRSSCATVMIQYRRCSNGSVPPIKFDSAQRNILRKY